MKKILLALMLIGFTILAHAQDKSSKGDLQIGVQGGVSIPIGTYKSVGEAKIGYFSGFFLDKYFKGNTFGLGLDARYLSHSATKQDTLFFANGYLSTGYKKNNFVHYFVGIGPTYKYEKNRFQFEAYIKGGIMQQHFPEYTRSLYYEDAMVSPFTMDIKTTVNDSTNKAMTWAGVGGLRFNYKLNAHFAIFAHVDYLQSFGTKFAGKNSQFTTEEHVERNPIASDTEVKSFFDHYEERKVMTSTLHQSVNVGMGVKYIFGRKAPSQVTEPVQQYDDIVKRADKGLQIVVKDKQTNLALSGVTVSVKGANVEERSISDANGQAARISAIIPGRYEIIGEKNGIKTPLLTLTEEDFNSSSSIIFKEIYHDDPRFTLIGETFDCAIEKNTAGVNTILTNNSSKTNVSQISDSEGKFIYQLEQNGTFSVVANQAGKYSQTEIVNTKGLDRSQTLYVTLKMGVCDLVEGGEWVLKNIHYDFDKSTIRADAAIILENVVSILQQNPTLRIELSSHTDSRGNDEYNQKLSQRRAESAVQYLINRGVAKDRLVAKGYGESRLINHCGNNVNCSEEMHEQNRRTEIKILAL
ncbi:OmpA family protein [Sphingobacterium pedocola]|uniref:Flagellar motor protein MotB n=1 Tax=Sphingobacterium pedocola TaxID=2082722 RepID=A0ABR9T3X8_9SPHI|nr:OmpA family protein [Sphingobacterium pedocola]MBE8720036.1 flagellar motor protein MotB [Sphingobacterium pedocola]